MNLSAAPNGGRFFKRLKKLAQVSIIGIVLVWIGLHGVPLPEELFAPPRKSLVFLDCTGKPLRELPEDDCYSKPIALSEISPHLIHAILSAEDERFWAHLGVDPLAILRAGIDWIRVGRRVSGASTVTQQLIKISHPRTRTLKNKCIEAIQALRLEQLWSKEKILEEYLNRVDYGNQRIGCQAASRYYFAKSPLDLSLAEAALLAGLPQAPTRLNPHFHREASLRRQRWVLERMRLNKHLNKEEYERAAQEKLKLQAMSQLFSAPHFMDFVLQHASISGDGASTVQTTLDIDLNRFTEKVIRNQLARLQSQHVGNGAAVIVENTTGNILALVGSENYFSPTSGQVNGAWAKRSSGSALKPFIYLKALEQGANAATIVPDLPAEFMTSTGVFRPVNYSRRCHGPVRYRTALACSLNIPAVRVLDYLGGAAPLVDFLKTCGLTTLNKPSDHYGLGLAIGNAEVRLIELAQAYSILASLGEMHALRFLKESPQTSQRIASKNAAWLIADILSDPSARAGTFGFESPLRFDYPVACKTGTSSDYRDNWAFGYTPEFTVGVWVGNFDGTPMHKVSGVDGAAPILHSIVDYLHQTFGTSWYDMPLEIVKLHIDPVTGKQIKDYARRSSILEKFELKHLPDRATPQDYDFQGRWILPEIYREWSLSGENYLAGNAVVASRQDAVEFRVISPLSGTIFELDPDLTANSRRLPLRTNHDPDVRWDCETLTLQKKGAEYFAELKEGHHLLRVFDRTGKEHKLQIDVQKL